MGLLKALGDFLFGKDPQIFDENGKVRHKFPEEKWKNWNKRFEKTEYDWRQHSAQTKSGRTASSNSTDKH